METAIMIAMSAALTVGAFFSAIGVIGILKFHSYYGRIQASTCITTLGVLGAVICGLIYAVYSGLGGTAYVKLVMIAILIAVSSAISAHALTKGTYKRGHRPMNGGYVKDDYEEDGFHVN